MNTYGTISFHEACAMMEQMRDTPWGDLWAKAQRAFLYAEADYVMRDGGIWYLPGGTNETRLPVMACLHVAEQREALDAVRAAYNAGIAEAIQFVEARKPLKDEAEWGELNEALWEYFINGEVDFSRLKGMCIVGLKSMGVRFEMATEEWEKKANQ